MDDEGTGTTAYEFGTWLLQQRELRGMTQEAAGTAAGFTATWWRNLEKGRQAPSQANVLAVARALGLPADRAFIAAGMSVPSPERLERLSATGRREPASALAELHRLVDVLAMRKPARLHAVVGVVRALID